MADQDLAAIGRAIIDSNLYMTIATVDAEGRPRVSPVFYAAAGYSEFLWISAPEVTHSQNIAQRPDVSIVIFDSQVAAGNGQAVYMTATAAQLTGDEVDRGLEIYPGPEERGGRLLAPDELRPPATYRLYRATVSQHSMLCPRDSGPCAAHGRAFDHRTEVSL